MSKNVLISVYDKTGIEVLAKKLTQEGSILYATDNTQGFINKHGIDCKNISEISGHNTLLKGKVKTLNHNIFQAILADGNDDADFRFDLVICNLYPFPEERSKENIDIGGHAVIRACLKNQVPIICNISDYDKFGSHTEYKDTHESAIEYITSYDKIVYNSISQEHKVITMKSLGKAKYGDNMHQKAQILSTGAQEIFKSVKGMSYNNILDASSAIAVCADFGDRPSCFIIKHNNTCAAAWDVDLNTAINKAFECDPLSSFGGIIAVNGVLNSEAIEKINSIYHHILICQGLEHEGLKDKIKANVLIQDFKSAFGVKPKASFRSIIDNLVLEQDYDNFAAKLEFPTKRKPTESELDDAVFAMCICKHTKSNAIVVVQDRMLMGICGGQTSRVGSASVAIKKAAALKNDNAQSSLVAASDAFFPFTDGLETLTDGGVECVLTPMGSKNDHKILDFADQNNICIIKTDLRMFLH